ncbi:MAG: glycosyltransferase family 39 protein [bacterium]
MNRKNTICLIFILFFSFLLNFTGINWGVPSIVRNKLYFENECEIKKSLEGVTEEKVVKSQTLYEGKLKGSKFNPIRSYHPDESQFIQSVSNMNPKKFDFNPHYFWYGCLYFWFLIAFLGIAYLVGYIKLSYDLLFFYLHPEEMAKFYITGRMVSVVFGVLTVLFVFLIAKKLYGEKRGLVSSLFLAITPFFVINSHYISTDIISLFFIALTFFISLKILESNTNKWYILGGIFAGLAGSAKYTGILVILIIHLSHFLKEKTLGCLFSKKVILSYVFALISFSATSFYCFISYYEVISCIKGVKGKGNIFSGILYYLRALYHGIGWPLLCLSFFGLILCFWKIRKQEVLMISWIVISILFFSLCSQRLDRYMLVIAPFLSIFASRSLDISFNKYLKNIVVFFVLVATFIFTLGYIRIFVRENVRTIAGKWILANIPKGTKIGVEIDPYQFETPPINQYRYNLCIAKNRVEIEKQSPQYFVLSDIQCRSRAFSLLNDIKNKGFKIEKEFSNPPRFFNIPFNENPSGDYLYLYPKIFIFKKNE